MKNVLLIPGTEWQFQLAQQIKRDGYNLYVVSPEDYPPCRSISDHFFQSDIFDYERILNYCKYNSIDGILSDECDIATTIVAKLGKELELNTIEEKHARLYTDKCQMRDFCCKIGLSHPEYKLCMNVNEAIDFFNESKRTSIIKPLDSNASHGVFIINSENDIVQHFEETISYSHQKKAVIIERYINGTEFTVDGVKTIENHYTLAISEKKHYKYNTSIANQLYFTHYNSKYDYEKLKEINDFFVNTSELKYGLTHAEYKYEDGAFYLIEIGARGGGNRISSVITPFMSGHDSYDYLISCALGDERDMDFSISDRYMERAAVLKFFDVPGNGGRVFCISGEDYLKESPNILDYSLNFKIGDYIHNAENDSARVGYYIAGAESREELDKVMEEVDSTFHFETEK